MKIMKTQTDKKIKEITDYIEGTHPGFRLVEDDKHFLQLELESMYSHGAVDALAKMDKVLWGGKK